MKFTQTPIDYKFIHESWEVIKSVIPKNIWENYPIQENTLYRDIPLDHAIKLYLYVEGTLIRSGYKLNIMYGKSSETITMEYFYEIGYPVKIYSVVSVGTNFLECIVNLLSNIKQTNILIFWQ